MHLSCVWDLRCILLKILDFTWITTNLLTTPQETEHFKLKLKWKESIKLSPHLQTPLPTQPKKKEKKKRLMSVPNETFQITTFVIFKIK